jgi:DNA-binding MarR family transcriptional regulator
MAPSPADPAPLVQRLIALVNRKSAGESTAFMHASGLTMPQIIVLYALRRSEASISELALRLRMSLPATSQLVDRLVEAGLVDRTEHARDRRVRRVTIRPGGLRFLERLGEMRLREIEDALRSLGPDSRALLAAALSQTVGELERELEERVAPPPPWPRHARTQNRRRA